MESHTSSTRTMEVKAPPECVYSKAIIIGSVISVRPAVAMANAANVKYPSRYVSVVDVSAALRASTMTEKPRTTLRTIRTANFRNHHEGGAPSGG